MTSNGPVFGLPPDGAIGEVKMFALSISGAITKAILQARGWAICDGTTAADQGVTSATITAATPNLENKFIMGSDNETSGSTGGESTHTLTEAEMPAHTHNVTIQNYTGGGNDIGGVGGLGTTSTNATSSVGNDTAHENKPPYYELVFFIKVRI